MDYAVGTLPVWAATGDFNADGVPDLAVVNSGSISILLGNGDGTFQPHVDYPVSTFGWVVTGDFNGDGKLDLAVSGFNTVSILLGNGDGTFGTPTQFPLGNATPTPVRTPSGSSAGGPELQMGDFNGDGKLDLAYPAAQSGVSIIFGNGDGTFQIPTYYAIGGYAETLVAGDFNGDGKLDLAAIQNDTQSGADSIEVLIGNGNGAFQSPVSYSYPGPGFVQGQFIIVASDFNGDGKLDLAVNIENPTGTAVLLGNGDGTFQAPQPYVGIFGSVAVDVNSDGRPDLVGLDLVPPATLFAVLNKGDGTFPSPVLLPVGPSFPNVCPLSAAAADFNNDGKPDAVVGSGTSISTFLGNGDGTFRPHIDLNTGRQISLLVAGDFNRDGKMDLAALDSQDWAVVILLGNGDGTFTVGGVFPTGPSPSWLATGDFNGDGKLDLVTTSPSANSVSILLGTGDGTFQPHKDYPTAMSPQQVVVGDFNGDGKLDIAVSGGGVAAGDFKGDGKLDLVGGPGSVLIGNGDGTFQPPVSGQFLCCSFGSYFTAADVNSDGKLDIVTGGTCHQEVGIAWGNGDGTFRSVSSLPIFSFGFPTTADFNGDGGLDLAVATSACCNLAGAWVWLNFPAIALYPTSIAFPGAGVGQSTTQSVLVSNPGSMPLKISSIVESGAGFTLNNSCGSVIPSGGNCTLTVTFSPSTTGASTGVITLTDSAPSSPQVIALTGMGVNGAYAGLLPGSLGFGQRFLGSSSAPQTVTLTNSGSAPLSISAISFSSGSFSQTNNCASSLAAGASCSINVTFTPMAVVGPVTGSLIITDNALNSPQTVSLLGTSLRLPISLSFGADFDADVEADVTVWRASTGEWWTVPSNGNSPRVLASWGTTGDIPVPGDYDGDHKTDLAVWRPSTGEWWVRASSTGALIYKQFGTNGDIPVPGDYDGDRITDFAVWRPSTGSWFIIPSGNPANQIVVHWGQSGDIPVPGDYDGDGKTDIAVWRPSTGEWWILASSTGALIYKQFGTSGDIPVPGDYDGDRKTDIAVWRPSTGSWFITPSSNPTTQIVVHWGTSGDIPVLGDYDGDGKTDIGVWRPSTGEWWILLSGNGGYMVRQWGAPTDVPINKPIGQ